MSYNNDPLEVDSLPGDPRIAAINLLGMASAELKDIDNYIESGSKNSIKGVRFDVNKILNDVQTVFKPQIEVSNVTPTVLTAQPGVHIPVQTVSTNSAVEPIAIAEKDNQDQLEFDFYKKIKPEDIELQLKNINTKLGRLESTLKNILDEMASKKNVNINGN